MKTHKIKIFAQMLAICLLIAYAAGSSRAQNSVSPLQRGTCLMNDRFIWLCRVMQKIEALKLDQDVLAMLPAPYFSPELGKLHPNWLIAYPYPPQNSADNTWQSPLSRWSQASCQILAKSAEQPNLAWWLENQQNNEKKPAASSHNLENLVQHQAVVLPWSAK